MRAMFGVVSLLIVVAIVGIVASRQLKAANAAPSAAPSSMVPPASVREQSQQLQQRVTNEVAGALQQGGDRNQQADK